MNGMEIFDFNIHLPCRRGQDTEERLIDEGSMGVEDLRHCYATHRPSLNMHMQGANFMLFNQDLPFGEHHIASWIAEVRRDWHFASFTQLLDFRRDGLAQALDRIKALGIEGVKFHSYVQHIGENDLPAALNAAELASERGL